ncbi:MAG TPA: Crp/Fnr family transcriptional regulator [Usitatibacteraceae bacterium]|nr:Crp/Fnr family transcriptional regulator [Usitatibacteraceae bacterium]
MLQRTKTTDRQPRLTAEPSSLGDYLARVHWAGHLTAAQLRQVEKDILVRRVPAGGFVCKKGESVDHWIGVMDGLAKMSLFSSEGKLTSLTGLPPGAWFGEGSLLKTEPRRYDILALRESRIAYLPRASFFHLLDNNIAFNRFLIVQLNERLGQFISLIEGERLLEPDARVARVLSNLFNPVLYPGLGLRLQISQEELGLLSGVSRQRVNQALHVLEAAGLLTVDYGGITVLDLAGLARFGR